MAGVIGTLQEVLTVVQRLSALENRIERDFKEMKDGLGAVRLEARDLDRRLLVLLTRFGGLAELAATEARAAAQRGVTRGCGRVARHSANASRGWKAPLAHDRTAGHFPRRGIPDSHAAVIATEAKQSPARYRTNVVSCSNEHS
jgi:hypothetical protein